MQTYLLLSLVVSPFVIGSVLAFVISASWVSIVMVLLGEDAWAQVRPWVEP
jgi:hypothetical protein